MRDHQGAGQSTPIADHHPGPRLLLRPHTTGLIEARNAENVPNRANKSLTPGAATIEVEAVQRVICPPDKSLIRFTLIQLLAGEEVWRALRVGAFLDPGLAERKVLKVLENLAIGVRHIGR